MRGEMDTEWIEREFLPHFSALVTAPAPEIAIVAAAIAELLGFATAGVAAAPGADGAEREMPSPFATLGAWRHPGLA
jgi:hypothetical protein